jgi:pimeloyl-ACP methyl ester carboxylesterase
MSETVNPPCATEQTVAIRTGGKTLEGNLRLPTGANGLVLFAHGSGSSRHSPRNKYVAHRIRDAGVGTLLFDLLTSEEERVDFYTRHYRFDVDLLASRLSGAADWSMRCDVTCHLRLGFFGSSTGAGAALLAAAEMGGRVGAVVSRGGRPDLAGNALPRVTAPTLLVVGGRDRVVVDLNRQAYDLLECEKRLAIVAGATHLFEEPGALEEVAGLASEWFGRHLAPQGA